MTDLQEITRTSLHVLDQLTSCPEPKVLPRSWQGTRAHFWLVIGKFEVRSALESRRKENSAFCRVAHRDRIGSGAAHPPPTMHHSEDRLSFQKIK